MKRLWAYVTQVFTDTVKQTNELKDSLLRLERTLKGERVDYSSSRVPASYRCCTCGAHGCKLWREYQTFLDQQTLECCDCAGKSQNKDVSTIDSDGRRLLGNDDGLNWGDQRSDSIGWRVPAVPTEEGDTYWGYSSVPNEGVAWWRRLPTRPAESG